jgi:hypothetical protein
MVESDLHIIRFAEPGDLDAIINFIRTDWNAEHIFVKDVSFFKFEFFYNDRIHFVLAVNKKTSQLDGIVGFIKYTQSIENSDVFGAIWKVKSNSGDPFLGVKILSTIKDRLPVRTFSGCGANPKTLPIYNYLGYKTGKLSHYYLLNNTLKTYNIADIRYVPPQPGKNSEIIPHLKKIDSMDELKSLWTIDRFASRKPYKDEWYLSRRYFNHPIYRYEIFGVVGQGGNIDSILVAREAPAAGSRALRIIDFIGNDCDLINIATSLQKLMLENNYEYTDFYQHGIDEEIMSQSGFTRRKDNDENIIPNYFEPFVRKNVEIHFFTSAQDSFHMFKGDGDQDRPNQPAKGNSSC